MGKLTEVRLDNLVGCAMGPLLWPIYFLVGNSTAEYQWQNLAELCLVRTTCAAGNQEVGCLDMVPKPQRAVPLVFIVTS
jgi:hypothetical protein